MNMSLTTCLRLLKLNYQHVSVYLALDTSSDSANLYMPVNGAVAV